MIVKTPGSQMGSPAAAEEGGEEVGGGRWESGERSEVQARSTLTSTAPKVRSRSGEVATLDEVPRISLRVSACHRNWWRAKFREKDKFVGDSKIETIGIVAPEPKKNPKVFCVDFPISRI